MVSFNAATSALAFMASISFTIAESSRKLSAELIAGYEPLSQVTDHNALDLDQEALELQLALSNDDAFDAAFKIYSEGAFSKSTAEVTLTAPLPFAVSKGTPVMGVGADGNQVAGKAFEDTVAGATIFRVQYQTSDSQKNYVNCQVGANPVPNTEGCLTETGTLDIDGTTVEYTYNILENNVAKRTLQGFSTEAKEKMWDCANCPYDTYAAFVDYYGAYDYGDEWVMAGFEGRKTNFKNFNNDFGAYGFDGKGQIIKKGTAYVIVWMYVIREMEDALDDCQEGCTIANCNDDPVHAWDEAVAFYTGTLEGTDGSGSGKFPYALADKRCGNFKTCGDMADSTTGGSWVNINIFDNFRQGQAKLARGECASARANKEAIESLMYIPLIQGTLRYAWKTDNEAYSEKAEAEGVIFYAGIAPMIHKCNPESAQIIADNMVAGQAGTAQYGVVKAAFESVYDCLGIDGATVGGYFDAATGMYFPGAEPMTTKGKKSASAILSLAVGAGVVAVNSLAMFW